MATLVSRMTGYVALGYVLWVPLDSLVARDAGASGFSIGVGIPAAGLVVFLLYIGLTSTRQRFGTALDLTVFGLIGSYLFAYLWYGGALGPTEVTRFFVPRMALVFSALAVGYRLGRTGILTPRVAGRLGVIVAVLLLSSLLISFVLGVTNTDYVTQGVRSLGAPSGRPIKAYVLAFTIPLLLFVRSGTLRNVLITMVIAGIVLTYRRGPLICAVTPFLFLPLVERRHRLPGQISRVALVAGVLVFMAFRLGPDVVFARWAGLIDGQIWAFSEREILFPALIDELAHLDLGALFGRGVGASLLVAERVMGRGVFGHNDWLEIAVTTGSVGVTFFLALHLLLVGRIRVILRESRTVGVPALVLYIQFALVNVTEGIVYAAQHGAFLLFFLGAAAAWGTRTSRHDGSAFNRVRALKGYSIRSRQPTVESLEELAAGA